MQRESTSLTTNHQGHSKQLSPDTHVRTIVTMCATPIIGNVAQKEVCWTPSVDHSKWGISSAMGSNTVCFGDNNRTKRQNKRNGLIVSATNSF